jgi:hypothetical protein
MSTLFKTPVPLSTWKEVLQSMTASSGPLFVMDDTAFKRGLYLGSLCAFWEACVPYYHVSKRHFVTRPLTFKTFSTVLRQVCRSHHLPVQSTLVYSHSHSHSVFTIGPFPDESPDSTDAPEPTDGPDPTGGTRETKSSR